MKRFQLVENPYLFLVVAACETCFTICAGMPAQASGLNCSNPEAKSAVIDLEIKMLRSIPHFDVMLDFENGTSSLEDVRTEDSNEFKADCAATMYISPRLKDARGDEYITSLQEKYARPIKNGFKVRYTVQNTDEGKLYVEMSQ